MTDPRPRLLLGVDIGGTKCAVALGRVVEQELHEGGPAANATRAGAVQVLDTQRFPTPPTFEATLTRLIEAGRALLDAQTSRGGEPPVVTAVGVSCGGPLDSRRGLILSPPNLPGWDGVDIVTPLAVAFGAPAALENDANAGALAEWRWGAGRGCGRLIFLTFGTGFGAGLILDGALYRGANDLAGEIGHVRLPFTLAGPGDTPQTGQAMSGPGSRVEEPVGYGKAGSVEGWLGGAGIARQARRLAERRLAMGEPVGYAPTLADLDSVTAQRVAEAATAGDEAALAIFAEVSERLGQTLALLVDLLNPERIVLGSIYVRARRLLEAPALATLRREALPAAVAACQILPSALGERIGDYASLAVALEAVAPTLAVPAAEGS